MLSPSADEDDLRRLEAGSTSVPAAIVMAVLAPSKIVVAILGYVALKHSATVTVGLAWWVAALVSAVLLPYTVLFLGMRTGRIADRQLVRRSQRPWWMAASATSVALGVMVLDLADAPDELVALILAMFAGLLCMTLVSLVWKVSMHSAVAAGACGVLLHESPWAAGVGAVLLPLLIWARWRAGRHSMAQLLVGALLGFVAAYGVYGAMSTSQLAVRTTAPCTQLAHRPSDVSACRLFQKSSRGQDVGMAGRPSKGDRDAMMTRPPRDVGLVARKEAAARGMSISEFVAAAIAKEVGMPDSFPMAPRRDPREGELPLTA